MKFIVKVMDERIECANAKEENDFDLLPIMSGSINIHLTCLGIVFMARRI